MKLWMKCTAYLLWVVGLIVLSWIAYRYSMHLKHVAQSDFIVAPTAWFQFIAPFLFGVYFSVLFIRSSNVRPNLPILLCICLPTFLLSIWIPLAWTLIPRGGGSSLIPVPSWVGETSMFYMPQFVCGFTFLYGLMTSKSERIQ